MNVYTAVSTATVTRFYKSIDNGLNWTLLSSTSNPYPYGLFISEDEMVVILGTSTVIVKSVNGGVTFSTVYTLPANGAIQDMCSSPVNENYLYACGRYGYVYLSTDKGATWSNVQLASFTTANYLHGIHMVSNLVGWAVGRLRIYKTTDGGANWTEQKLLAIEPYDVYAVDENTVYVLEGSAVGVVWKTIDGGANWTSLATARQYAGGRLMVREDKIWFTGINAAANKLEVVYSTDAGLNWNRVEVAGYGMLSVAQLPITFIDDNQGFAVGFYSYYSNDGGQTWATMGYPWSGYIGYALQAMGALLVEWRSFNVAGAAPTNRTIEGSAISAANPLNFGSVGPGNDSPVKCLIWRASSLGIYTTISDMRAWLQSKDLVGTNFYYMDITNTWTVGKTPAQVAAGTPGTCPQSLPGAANLTKIGGGDITGVGHADTSQYVYVCFAVGGDEVGGEDIALNYRVNADKT